MQLLGSVCQAVSQPCADRTEGGDAAYNLCPVSPIPDQTVEINIGAVNRRISQSKAGYVPSRLQLLLYLIRRIAIGSLQKSLSFVMGIEKVRHCFLSKSVISPDAIR